MIGAVAGLLIALVPIAIACIVDYAKNAPNVEVPQESSNESDLSPSFSEDSNSWRNQGSLTSK